MTTREMIRNKVFAEKHNRVEIVNFFGADIEIRQMILADIISAQASTDRESAIIDTLVKYAYVPGTDEKVFEDTDADALKQLPFDGSFVALSEAMERLVKVNFLDKKSSSGSGQTST